jgi:hypothetical protein
MTSLSPDAGQSHRPLGLRGSIALSLAVATIIHVLVLSRGFFAATFDDSGRTLDAYSWITGTGSLVSVWPPFYKLIVGSALFIAPDLFVTPRVVSYLGGITALCSLVWLSHVLFKNRITSAITGLLGAVFPPRVVLSVAPLSEIMFVTAITLAIAFLARWFSDARQRDIMLSATSFAIASSIRYEGWVFAALFAALAVISCLRPWKGQKLTPTTALVPILGAVSFMVLWITLYLMRYGRPFGFVADTAGRYALIHGGSSASLLSDNPSSQFALQNVWTLNILGLLFLPPFIRRNLQNRILVGLPGLALLMVSAMAFWGKGMPTHGFWRIPFVWSMLLVPFTAQWFAVRLNPPNAPAKYKPIAIVCLLVGVFVLCEYGIYSSTEHSAFSRHDLAAGRYVHAQLSGENRGVSHKVLIESDIWSYANVMIASQHPEQFVLNTGFDPVAQEEPVLSPEAPFDGAMLRRMDVGLLVFRRDDYRNYLDARAEMRKLKDYGPWTIYAFLPLQSNVSPGIEQPLTHSQRCLILQGTAL